MPAVHRRHTEGGGVNIEVRIRHELDEKGETLCDWPIDRLEELVEGVGAWGVFVASTGYSASNIASGQFVIGSGRPFFDLVVHDDA